MEAARKAKLGQKWTCYSCQLKFYDLAKPEPLCPKCQADQRQSPAFEKPKRTRGGKKAAAPKKAVRPPPPPPTDTEEEADATIAAEDLEFDDVEIDEADATPAATFDDDAEETPVVEEEE